MTGVFLAIFGARSPALAQKIDVLRHGVFDLTEQICTDKFLLMSNNDIEARALDDGAVFGSLFRKTGERIRILAPPLADSIIATRGRTLVDDLWGSYVAIWRDPDGSAYHVLRAPTGTLPCYVALDGANLLFSNDAALLGGLRLKPPEIDWDVVATHLRYHHLRLPRTAIKGVSEIVGGTKVAWRSREVSSATLWSPWDFCGDDCEITDIGSATSAIADTTTRVVASMAEGFRHVLLGVSGGLDSSIVAACLEKAGITTTCFTLVSQDAVGDEREYAHALTTHLGLPVVDLHEDPALVVIERSGSSSYPRPVARAFAQSGDTLQQGLAASVGADVYFSGAGGDNVFAYLPSVSPVSDRLLRQGLSGGLETAVAMSKMTNMATLPIIISAMRRAWMRSPSYVWRAEDSLLTPSAATRSVAPASHPWLSAPKGGLPGKAAHIAWLVGIQNHLEGFDRERERPLISPLMAQPLVEICLRIPTWLWCYNGRNRAIARLAFESDLPHVVSHRRGKGSPDGFIIRLFETHRAAIAAFLLDGNLVREELVDRQRLEALLSQPRQSSSECGRLISLVDVEAWTRSWQAI